MGNLKNRLGPFKRGLSNISHFFYPGSCLHCGALIRSQSQLFCGPCIEAFELIDPKGLCPACFKNESTPGGRWCQGCHGEESLYDAVAACFDYRGPPASAVKALKFGGMPYTSKILGAYLALQLTRLNWRWPDLIVPMPLSFGRWMERGYNQSALLAGDLGGLIGVPVRPLLGRRQGSFPQAKLSGEQRRRLDEDVFVLRRPFKLPVFNRGLEINPEGKNILMIDDVFTTGTTLRRAASTLLALKPATLYALTVCR